VPALVSDCYEGYSRHTEDDRQRELQERLGRQQPDAEWITAAETALAKNKAICAVLPMYQMKNPTGQLATLREPGYSVEEPQ
jgi:hypothetical protein